MRIEAVLRRMSPAEAIAAAYCRSDRLDVLR